MCSAESYFNDCFKEMISFYKKLVEFYLVSLSIPIAASHIMPTIARYPKVCTLYFSVKINEINYSYIFSTLGKSSKGSYVQIFIRTKHLTLKLS